MTGYERAATAAIAAGGGVTVVLSLALTPLWGVDGAAIASACGAVVMSVLAVSLASRKLGMHLAPLRPVPVARPRL
jgi:O-antigen/teichoic acid export membrane protein